MKNKLNIDKLKPDQLFLEHTNNFLSFKPKLDELYNDNPNKDKIVALLDYWVFSIYCLKKFYGKDGLINFCDGHLTNPQRFSFLYELSNYSKGTALRKSLSNKYIFKILNFSLRRLYLPGASLKSFVNKVRNRLSLYYIYSLPAEEDLTRKENLFMLLDKLMTGYLSENEIVIVKHKIPKFFYSKKVRHHQKSDLIYLEGSCASFLEFSGYENILLLDAMLKIEGYQHGGGYDIFKIDYFAAYEKRLSDVFYGWGFSKDNKPQNKFKKINDSQIIISDPKRVFWIEDSSVPSFYFCSMPQHHYQSVNKKTKSYIFDELDKQDIKYSSLFHPISKSSLYNNFRKDDHLVSGNGHSENIINQDDILIFDNSGSTLIHFAIENNISFYSIISRQDFNNFTVLQKKYFLMLQKHNLGFYNDEIGKMGASIMLIRSDSDYSLPQELHNLNNSMFKNNMPSL
tara:strand:+ start:2565 stop:3932 length:1368 start_codon:yes stop_codon:yes gene_type:complete